MIPPGVPSPRIAPTCVLGHPSSMTAKPPLFAIALMLCVASVSCVQHDSTLINDDAGGGSAGASGQIGGAGGAQVGGSDGGTSGAAGSAAVTCTDLPGPPRVELPAPNGARYCIDSTEVTQSQYAEFLKEVATTPGSEHPQCESNTTYTPYTESSIPYEPADCSIEIWNPILTPNHPVVCVDWCDAYAYCVWAGKRLCGKIGGGPGSFVDGDAAPDPATDPTLSQWYSACSQGGKTAYPYGDTYKPQACQTYLSSSADGGLWLPTDVGAWPDCKGAEPPYSSVFNMSGFVQEFTDECLLYSNNGYTSFLCAARGGAVYLSDLDQMTCAYYGGAGVQQHMSSTGIRCCKDLQ